MTTKRQIAFIDSRVADYQTLIDGLEEGTAWYLLDAHEDGISQMEWILSDYSDLEAIQIISHGSQGTLYLGNMVLDAGNLSAYQSSLQTIGESLSETGDILLYGCNVAQGDTGIQFIESLAAVTGADVAASDINGERSPLRKLVSRTDDGGNGSGSTRVACIPTNAGCLRP